MLRTPWTEDELDYLREYYGTIPVQEMARRMPGRTVAAICARASEMGLRSALAAQPDPFSDEENAYIREHYGKIPASEIEQTLGRGRKAIQQRARRMGLSLRPRCQPVYQKRYLPDNLRTAFFDFLIDEVVAPNRELCATLRQRIERMSL